MIVNPSQVIFGMVVGFVASSAIFFLTSETHEQRMERKRMEAEYFVRVAPLVLSNMNNMCAESDDVRNILNDLKRDY